MYLIIVPTTYEGNRYFSIIDKILLMPNDKINIFISSLLT